MRHATLAALLVGTLFGQTVVQEFKLADHSRDLQVNFNGTTKDLGYGMIHYLGWNKDGVEVQLDTGHQIRTKKDKYMSLDGYYPFHGKDPIVYLYRPKGDNLDNGVQWREWKFNDDQTISLRHRDHLGCLALEREGRFSKFVLKKDDCMKFGEKPEEPTAEQNEQNEQNEPSEQNEQSQQNEQNEKSEQSQQNEIKAVEKLYFSLYMEEGERKFGFKLGQQILYSHGTATSIESIQDNSNNRIKVFMDTFGRIRIQEKNGFSLDAYLAYHGNKDSGVTFYKPNNGQLAGSDWNRFQVNNDRTISIMGKSELGCLAASEATLVVALEDCIQFDVSQKEYFDLIAQSDDNGQVEKPKGPSYKKCHKAPAENQFSCHGSEPCEYITETFSSAEDGITLSGCAAGGAGAAEGEACAGYSQTEIEQKSVSIKQTVGAGKFVCGVYLGQYDDEKGKWNYNFYNFFGEIDGQFNTCFKLIKRKIPEYSEHFCKSTHGQFGYKGVALSLISLIMAAFII